MIRSCLRSTIGWKTGWKATFSITSAMRWRAYSDPALAARSGPIRAPARSANSTRAGMHSARPTEVDSSADPIASTPTSVPAWWIGAYAWERMPTSRSVFTEHFGLVSDFLAETWTRLRDQSRLAALQGRVYYGGALSGRDTNAVNKTVSGLLKLLYPDTAMEISDADIEWAVRLALESRRRVKEQQKRVGAMEFRNTHFSYTMGENGVEKFVTTPG